MKRFLLMAYGCLLIGVLPANAQDLDTEAPSFVKQTVAGDAVQLADYKGKIVLLDFWASWCGPCLEEMPFLIELYKEFEGRPFEIIGINIDTDLVNMQGFLDELDVEVPFVMVHDPDGDLPAKYDLEGMPTTVLLDQHGVIRYRHTGFRNKDEAKYRKEVETLLHELEGS